MISHIDENFLGALFLLTSHCGMNGTESRDKFHLKFIAGVH